MARQPVAKLAKFFKTTENLDTVNFPKNQKM